jgi:hypothetical protein
MVVKKGSKKAVPIEEAFPPKSKVDHLWPILDSAAFDNGTLGVFLPTDHTLTVGRLVDVNGHAFRVHSVSTNGEVLLAPFKLHGYPEHNPLEKPAIKKEWVQEIVAVQQKLGTTHADIEFMADMFEDTPVDTELVKHLNLKDEQDLPTKPKIDFAKFLKKQFEMDTGDNPDAKPPVKIYPGGGELKSDYIPGMTLKDVQDSKLPQKLPHIIVNQPPKASKKPLAQEVIDKLAKEVADDLEHTLMDLTAKAKGTELVCLKVKQAPPDTSAALVELLQQLAHCSSSMAIAAIASKAWVEVDVQKMAQYAEKFSYLENIGVVFEVKDVAK